MVTSNGESRKDDERMKELKAFDDTKLGVKGIVDAGIVNIPKMFVRPAEDLVEVPKCPVSCTRIPVIDLDGLLTTDRHRNIIDEIRSASETWGFFQVVNHAIPMDVLGNMLAGVKAFNEQDVDGKKGLYGREIFRQVRFNSNYDLFQTQTVGWRDSLTISMVNSSQIDRNDLPVATRDVAIEFINHVTELGNKLFDLLSEALGLKPDHLRSLECNDGRLLTCHYYPECPEPELAIGLTKHTDNSFITIIAQDQTGGLQVLHENQFWVDVEPIPGALVVNIGDFLQLVSNDKFKSNVHRVLPSRQPRVSMALFFAGRFAPPARARLYGPIKELTSEENPPKYKEVLLPQHLAKFYAKGLHEKQGLEEYRL